MIRFLFCFLLVIVAAHAGEYSKTSADFSNGSRHTLRLSDGVGEAALFVNCDDEPKSFWVSIYIDDVIFPDDSRDQHMYLKVTHKFDTAESAHSAEWIMPMMKYHSAQLPVGDEAFIQEGVKAGVLAVRQDTAGATYRFALDDDDRKALGVIGEACGLLPAAAD